MRLKGRQYLLFITTFAKNKMRNEEPAVGTTLRSPAGGCFLER